MAFLIRDCLDDFPVLFLPKLKSMIDGVHKKSAISVEKASAVDISGHFIQDHSCNFHVNQGFHGEFRWDGNDESDSRRFMYYGFHQLLGEQ